MPLYRRTNMSFTRTGPVTQIPYVAGEKFTEENHAAEADINFIVDQFTRTGVLSHNMQHEGQYGDFVSGDVYELAQDAIANANTMFESLPQHVRQQFPQGTGQFLDFINDEANRDEIKALGLTTSHLPDFEVQPVPSVPDNVEQTTESVTDALSDSNQTNQT